MTDEALLENQVKYLYNAAAKRLYSLALYSVQNQLLAEQLAIDAFVFAYNHLIDKSDVTQFQIKSARQLYRKTKKELIDRSWHNTAVLNTHEIIEFAHDEGKKRIHSLLTGLNYDERFLLLLIFQQRFSRKQIAQILYIPKFIVKKRLYRMINKTMNVWAKLTEHEYMGKPV